MRKGILVTGVTFALIGVGYLFMASRLDMGTMDKPGAGVYPVFVGIILVIATAGTIVSALLQPIPGAIKWPKGVGLGRVLAIGAVTFFYALALEFVGYLICSAMVLLVCFHVMGMRSWPRKIGLTFFLMAFSFLVFDRLLRVPLPQGVFSFF